MSDKTLDKGDSSVPAKKERSKTRKKVAIEEFWYDPMSYPSYSRKS
jgi:hypothetical protein